MTLSKNGVGIAVFVLSLIGVNVAEGDLLTTVATIGQIVGGALAFWNQLARSDSKWFIFKK